MARGCACGRARLILWIFKIIDFWGPSNLKNVILNHFLWPRNVGERKDLNLLSIILRSHAFLINISIFSEIWIFNIFRKKCNFLWKMEKWAKIDQKLSILVKKTIFSICFKMLQNHRKSIKNGRGKSQNKFKKCFLRFRCLLGLM